MYLKSCKKDYYVINHPKFVKRVLLNCKFNVKERIFDKEKMLKGKKSKLVFCLFGPLIS